MRWSKRCCSRFDAALYFAAVRAALRPHFSYFVAGWVGERAFVSRLFYPTLFLVTAVLAAMLWTRHGLPVEWLSAIGVRAAWGQAGDNGPPPANSSATSDRYGPDQYQRDRYGRERDAPTAPVRRRPRGYTSLRRSAPAAAPQNVPAPPSRRTLVPAGPQTRSTSASPAALPETAHRTRPSPISEALIEAPAAIRSLADGRVPVEGSTVLARVGATTVILAADILPLVDDELAHHRGAPPDQLAQYREFLVRQHLEQLIVLKLIVEEAKGRLPTEQVSDVKKRIGAAWEKENVPRLKKQHGFKTDAELDAFFKSKHTSRDKIKEQAFEEWLKQQWINQEVKTDETVRHEELLTYYHAHFDEYKFPAKARFEELRIDFSRHRDKEEAWRLICELGNRVARGEPWAEVAKAHSEGLHAEAGGRYDWTSKGSLKTAAIDQAIFSLEIGRASKVIEDQRGYSIVRVIERKDAGVESFEEAQIGIRDQIREERRKLAQATTIRKFFEKNRATIWIASDPTGQPASDAATTAARPGSSDQPRRR